LGVEELLKNQVESRKLTVKSKGVEHMTSDTWDILEARVVMLEKQNRWMKGICLVVGLSVACAMTLGQSEAANTANTVEAQRFVLKNAKGEVRAELSTVDGDYPRLILRSPNGQKVTELSPLGISVIDHGLSGKLPLAHFGDTGLYFTDKQGQIVIELGGASTSAAQLVPIPEMAIFNEKGQPVWRAP
jgi:hypothetical protein